MLALSELLCYVAIAVLLDRKYRRNATKSREWTKKWLLKRQDFSHISLLKELRFHPKDWHNFLRMNESAYLTLLSMVSPLIQKKEKSTTMRQAVTPHERLTATLRFLATGRSYENLRFSTIMSPQTPRDLKYVKKNQFVSRHKTQLMTKLNLFLSYDMFRPTTTAIVRLYTKPF